MKLTTGTSSGRAAYYDRNPLDVVNQYIAAIAPASLTVRWTYTVPAARKAYVESAFNLCIRETVATTAGDAWSEVTVTPNGGANTFLGAAVFNGNVVGNQGQSSLGSVGLLQAGDALIGKTLDNSSGGTVQFAVASKATEFDA